jgi:UDP-glucose 4-epimerase
MKKILITGASGFLAKSVINFLVSENAEIVALTRPGAVPRDKIFSSAYDNLDALLLAENEFSSIFHLAAYIPDGAMNQPDHRLVNDNILLTGRLVNAYSNSRFVYASSVAVYGRPHVLPIEVESPYINPDLYGLSKLAGEAIVRNHPNHAIIRFSSIIGGGLKANSFIPTIIEKALKTRMITILGDGRRKQNYIDVRDAASLCLAAAKDRRNIITLGVADRSYSNREVAKIVADQTRAEVTFTGTDDSPSFSYGDSVSIQLNYQPRYSLEQTIFEMIQK